MDLQLPFSLTNFIIFFFFLYFFVTLPRVLKRPESHNETNNKQIPGPWKLPLIGNILNMVSSLSPHQTLTNLAKKHGPIIHLQLGEISTVIISSPQLAEQVMKKHDHAFVSRHQCLATKIVFYNNRGLAFVGYGDYWRQMRKICTLQLFSAKKVKSFAPIRDDEATRLILSIQSALGSPINVSEKIFEFTSDTVCRASFGNKCEDIHALMHITREILETMGSFYVADLFPSLKILHMLSRMRLKLERLHKELDKIFDKIIAERKGELISAQKDDADLLDILLRVQENQGLDVPITTNDVKSIIFDMFLGGTDTSVVVVEWAMAEMIKNPRVMHKAQLEVRDALKGKKNVHETNIEGLSYLKLVIKETLRLHPPVCVLGPPRVCSEECEIGGYIIPVNTRVSINVWAISRDPEYFVNPDSFEPERFENRSLDFAATSFAYIPFGAGRRSCPGASFALAGVMLSLARLLYHFDWKLPNGMKPDDLDMTEGSGLTNPRKDNLYLVPSAYVTPI